MGRIVPIILSGGSGTRLWPLSSAAEPKQFHALTGTETLFQQTLKRLSGPLFDAAIVIANKDHQALVTQSLQRAGQTDGRVILEPLRKNTAPAIALAALVQGEQDPETLMLVAASDSSITKPEQFYEAITFAIHAAEQDMIVTFGLAPDRAETGYGYIRRGDAIDAAKGLYQVGRFVEKPDAETARAYLEGGEHTWNSSMFLFRARVFLEQLELYRPDILADCRNALRSGSVADSVIKPEESVFASIDGDSIDYAVMENCTCAAVVETEFGWSDVGSWEAIWGLNADRDDSNVAVGNVLLEESSGCLAFATQNSRIAVIGCENLVVVANDDKILVVPRHLSQLAKRGVEVLGD